MRREDQGFSLDWEHSFRGMVKVYCLQLFGECCYPGDEALSGGGGHFGLPLLNSLCSLGNGAAESRILGLNALITLATLSSSHKST